MTPHRYRKLSPRVWSDEKFTRLTPEEKLLFLYVVTGPQANRIGLFRFSPAMAAEDLGFDTPPGGVGQPLPPPVRESFTDAFEAVRKVFGWGWDAGVRVLFLPKWFIYNPPEGANNLTGNLKDLAELPQTTLLQDFAAVLRTVAEPLGVPLPPPLREVCPDPSPKPSRTQEQEQEQEQEHTPPASPSGDCGDKPAKAKKAKKAKKADPESDPRFDQFWQQYPRKENRKKAVEAFAKLAPDDALFGVMMAALGQQKLWPKWTKDDGQFIPHAATWINNRRWEDRPPDVLPSPPKPTTKTITSNDLDTSIYGPAPGGSR